MGIWKRLLIFLLAGVSLWLGTVSSLAVTDGELQLDGQRSEREIWNSSHAVPLYETGILPADSGITYAGMSYLIDENRKEIYFYIQYLDESSGLGTSGAVNLEFSDGTAASFYTDNRAVSYINGAVSYYVLDLGAQGFCVEAEISFDTITQAEDALENISVSFTDRANRRTGVYQLAPVFPTAADETRSSEETSAEPEEEETTKKRNTSKESTTKKSSSERTTRRETTRRSFAEEDEETVSMEGHTVDYIISDSGESDYRLMTAAVLALLLVLVAVCIGWLVHHLIRKRNERKITPKSAPAPSSTESTETENE